MTLLNKKQVLESEDVKTEKLVVPEWGGEILIKSLDGERYNEYQRFIFQNAKPENSIEVQQEDGSKIDVNTDGVVLKVCALHIIDPRTGELMFTVDELKCKSYRALGRIFKACQKLSGLGKDEAEEVAEGLKKAQG